MLVTTWQQRSADRIVAAAAILLAARLLGRPLLLRLISPLRWWERSSQPTIPGRRVVTTALILYPCPRKGENHQSPFRLCSGRQGRCVWERVDENAMMDKDKLKYSVGVYTLVGVPPNGVLHFDLPGFSISDEVHSLLRRYRLHNTLDLWHRLWLEY
jgi:hypothetical protein